ncbi:carbon-nitrogen hydrolase family protein [Ewingella sp. S1.OA.A_B6]
MNDMIIAAAQLRCAAGDIDDNIQRHLQTAEQAAAHNVDFLLFPELSLTGYEPEMADQLAITLQDPRLAHLRESAMKHKMTLVCGAPLRSSDADVLYIGAIVFAPDGTLYSYTKQHLHDQEAVIFTAGQGGPLLQVQQHQIGLAICADILSDSHPQHAADTGATVYAAGVLITKKSYPLESSMLQRYAEKYRMVVVLANHCAPTGVWEPGGQSAIWDETGHLIIAAPDSGDALAIARKTDAGWLGEIQRLTLAA